MISTHLASCVVCYAISLTHVAKKERKKARHTHGPDARMSEVGVKSDSSGVLGVEDLSVDKQEQLKAWPNTKNTCDFRHDIYEVDGSVGEGGGQILRITLAMAGLHSGGRRFKVSNIRAGRPKPGLSAQHQQCACLVMGMAGLSMVGWQKGSETLFIDSDLNNDTQLKPTYLADIKTAGSLSLIVQASLPVMLLMDARDLIEKKQFSRLVLKGGTNVPFSPSIDHVQLVLLPLLERHFNVRATLDIKKRGYYPKGGGEVVVKVGTDLRRDMKALSPINLTEVGTVVATKVVVTGIMPEKKEWCDEVIYFLEEMIVSRYNWTAVREYDVDVTCVLEVSSTEKEGEWMTGGTGGVKSAMATDVYSKVTVKSKPKTKQEEQAEAHEKRQQLLSGTLKKTAARRGDALYGGLPSDGTIATKINKAHSAKRQRSNARAEKESKRLNTDFTLGMDLVVTTSTGCILHASDLRTGKNLTTQLAAPMLTTLLNKMDDIMKSGATVDEHTADQLLVYMATTSGKSTIIAPPKDHTSSQHLETAIDLVGQLAGLQPGFEVVVLPSGARKIICWTGAAVGGEVVVGGKVLEDPLWAKFRERQFKLGLGPDPYASEKDAKKKEEAIVRAVADMGKSKGKLMEEARARKREEEVAALFTDSEEGKK